MLIESSGSFWNDYAVVSQLSSFLRLCLFRRKHLAALLIGLVFVTKPLAAGDIYHSNFESYKEDDNPWAGASTTGFITVIPGKQPAVDSAGQVSPTVFGPSVAVGDLNGDGLQDLVIGDSRGFFWFFPNSGTATAPAFTHGEIIPIWFGAAMDQPDYDEHEGGADNVVPHTQLISLGDGSKILDLVVGNYNGRLFYLHNGGGIGNPVFRTTPSRLKDLLIKTRKDGLLWSNFICPFLYDWWGTGNLDLIMGDGSYSANSIFLFKNLSNRDSPIFNETSFNKIIPGMGREHLSPQVVDWNGDGKPDIITGDRLGHLTLFLNTSADAKQPVPTFDDGNLVKLGGKDTFGAFTNVTVCDLTGNKLPNLIITNQAGVISYATNTGKPGAPQFSDPVQMKGVNPFPKILRPVGWELRSPYGVPNELLVTTNATIQPEFKPPPNTPLKSAMRYWVYPITNKYFPEFYYPISDQLFDDTHWIMTTTGFPVTDNTTYHFKGWIYTTGNITNLQFRFWGYRTEQGEEDENVNNPRDLGTGSSWTQIDTTTTFTFRNRKKTEVRHESANVNLWITWNGQGEIYLDDLSISEQQ
jgi:hypothetical protein